MSHYLIERIEADPKIDLLTGVEVQALAGEDHLEAGDARRTPQTGERARRFACSGLFCFIGAQSRDGVAG